MSPSVDYVTEREARAIRCNAFGLRNCFRNHANMTIVFQDRDGLIEVPEYTVQRFMEDWHKSGAWSLHGSKGDPGRA